VFDARTGELLRTLTGHTGRVFAVAFSPDGKFLAGGNWAPDKKMSGSLKVWNLKTGEVTLSLEGGVGDILGVNYDILGVNYSSDGKRLFATGPGGVRMWDRTGKLVRTFKPRAEAHGFYHLGLSPD